MCYVCLWVCVFSCMRYKLLYFNMSVLLFIHLHMFYQFVRMLIFIHGYVCFNMFQYVSLLILSMLSLDLHVNMSLWPCVVACMLYVCFYESMLLKDYMYCVCSYLCWSMVLCDII